ncbi:MAG: hypothetical protein U5J83_14470 [Bryobacterales bacterium]|nr:hypothetical protein [Bryobacterales bacterium]
METPNNRNRVLMISILSTLMLVVVIIIGNSVRADQTPVASHVCLAMSGCPLPVR